MTKFTFLAVLLFSLLVSCSSNKDNNLTVAALDNNSGFGGTGLIQRLNDDEGSGFGGTGIVGNIQAFGSIWVNGIKIEYDTDVDVVSNLALKNEQLKLGQQVILETDLELTSNLFPKTQKIAVFYPIAGRIDAIKEQQILVQKQWIKYSKDTFKDDGLSLTVGDFVIVNAIQINNNHWLASRFNDNKDQLVHFQTKMTLNFSKNIQTVIIHPKLAKMQWENMSQLFSHNTMIIGRWNHHDNKFMHNSIQQREMMKRPSSMLERPAEIINNMNDMRPRFQNAPIRDIRRMMPNR